MLIICPFCHELVNAHEAEDEDWPPYICPKCEEKIMYDDTRGANFSALLFCGTVMFLGFAMMAAMIWLAMRT